MNRRAYLGCSVPLIIVGGLIWYGIHSMRGAADSPPHYAVVDRGDVEIKVTETGEIEPLKRVDIKSKVAGRVTRLLVDEGSRVKEGQILAVIDPTEINSQVAQIQAQLDGALAHLKQAEKGADYQKVQTVSGIDQARETLRTAQARLRVAEQQNQIQPSLSGSALRQAEANLQSAKDALAGLNESAHPQAVVQAQAAYDEAKAAAENAKRNHERQQTLLERGFVSEQVVDAARSEHSAADARLANAKKHLDLIQDQNKFERFNAESRVRQEQAALDTAKANMAQVSIARHELDVAKAAVAQARAQLRGAESSEKQDRMREDDVTQARASVVQLQNQLKENQVHQFDTTLTATMAGTVTKRYIEAGELVTSGITTFSTGTPVLRIADLSQMLVKMSLNEVDVQKIRTGLPVEIAIDSVRGVAFHGRVTRVAPAAISAAGAGQDSPQPAPQANGGVIKFAVEVTVDRPDSRLKPGMSAKCSIMVARRRNVLRLPTEGVAGEGDSAEARIVSQAVKDGRKVDSFTPRKVRIGLRGDTFVEILDGLKEGEQVKPNDYTGPKRKAIDINMD